MEQILEHGEVKRGQIGIFIQPITPDLRKAFDLENSQQGVIVSNVGKDSPAEKAGVKEGDVIIAVNGDKTTSVGQLRTQIGMKAVGEEVELTVLRNGKTKKIDVKVEEPSNVVTQNSRLHKLLEGARFENNPEGEGVIIAQLAPNSSASYSGLRPGDIIIGANRLRVHDLNSFQKALQRDSDKILLRINRNGGTLYIVIQ